MMEPRTDVVSTLIARSDSFSGDVMKGISAPFNTPVVAVQVRMSYSFVSVPTSCNGVVAHVSTSRNRTSPGRIPWQSLQPPCLVGRLYIALPCAANAASTGHCHFGGPICLRMCHHSFVGSNTPNTP